MNIRKILAFALGPIAGAFLGFITLPITAWFFSAEDIGRIAFFSIIMGLSTMTFGLGLDQAYVREYHERSNKPELWKQVVLPGTIVLLLSCLLLVVIRTDFLSKMIFDLESIQISILIIIAIISNYYIRFCSLILRMQEKGFLFSMSLIWPKLFNLLFLIALVMVFHHRQFIYLLYAQVIASTLACLIFAWNTRSEWTAIKNWSISISELKPLLKFGFPLFLGGLVYWGLNSIDRLFLKSFSTFPELGIYSIATSFASVAIILQTVFSTLWAPSVYKWIKNNENLDKIHEISWYLTIVIVFIFACVGLFSNLIALILPSKYSIVQYLVLPTLIAPLLYTLSETTVVGIGISRKSHLSLYASLGAFISAILLNYLLTPRWGALGASLSSGIAFSIFFILRTELSVIAWRSFPRLKIYCIIFMLVLLSICNAIFQEQFFWLFKCIWLMMLIFSVYGIWKIFLIMQAQKKADH